VERKKRWKCSGYREVPGNYRSVRRTEQHSTQTPPALLVPFSRLVTGPGAARIRLVSPVEPVDRFGVRLDTGWTVPRPAGQASSLPLGGTLPSLPAAVHSKVPTAAGANAGPKLLG